MELPLEAVPNFSEGRDEGTIAALREAMGEHARLLDVHSDRDHNRSVFTLVGDAAELLRALVAGVACARERIDLRRHEGVHPCLGAADVVPIVALRPEQMEDARAVAITLAEAIGDEIGVPVFLYRESGEGRGPAFFRRGGLSELQRRIDTGEVRPDFGPTRLDPAAGCVLVGARSPLVAFNLNLASADVEVARAVAAVVRESGGGFRGVRALGLPLPSRGLVQVSMNIEDWQASPLHEIVARIELEAAERGVQVAGSELVGLMPAGAAAAVAGSALQLDGFDESRLLEPRLLP